MPYSYGTSLTIWFDKAGTTVIPFCDNFKRKKTQKFPGCYSKQKLGLIQRKLDVYEHRFRDT